MRPRAVCVRAGGVAVFMLLAMPAAAQRASDNVVTSAQDAFGTAIGNESIGLYSQTEARGFSPKDAGNFRIEGLYYDQAGYFGNANVLAHSTAMRVGISAQSYPFPAPTGIADIRLRLPGQKRLTSFNAQYGPLDTVAGQADIEAPRDGRMPGRVVSVATGNRALEAVPRFNHIDVSGLLQWMPTDATEVIAFGQHNYSWDGKNIPNIFTAGSFLPPHVNRRGRSGPSFPQDRGRMTSNFGLIVRSALSENWRLQTGLFRSTNSLHGDYSMLDLNTQPNGIANLSIRARPDSVAASNSGEVRVSRLFQEGTRLHTVHFSAKGRAVNRRFGGDQAFDYGLVDIRDFFPITPPTLNFGPQTEDTIRHGSLGVAYVGLWPGVGELSAGAQKAFYRRALQNQVLGTSTVTSAHPWLYNGTLAIEAGKNLTFYAGYTRGLEDSVIAPENATNRGEAPATSLTTQVEAGLRYRLSPSVTLVAGVFKVQKPYFDRDPTALYTRVGNLSHRGVELSLTGDPLQGLRIVAGAVLLKARVTGPAVDQGLIGKVPTGRVPALVRLNVNYGPPAWHGFSVNSQVKFEDSPYANRLNTVRIAQVVTLDLGARYNFKIHDTTASMRLDIQNVTDVYTWTVNPASGHFVPSFARRVTVRFAAEI